MRDFEPENVILDIGTNDLSTCSPYQLASEIATLVETLRTDYQIQFVVVVQILPHFKSLYPSSRPIDNPKFNTDVESCYELLVENSLTKPSASFGGIKGFEAPTSVLCLALMAYIFLPQRVNLNTSIICALLLYCT